MNFGYPCVDVLGGVKWLWRRVYWCDDAPRRHRE